MGAKDGQHREIEIKLDAAEDFPLPALEGLPGVATVTVTGEERLDAVYLDSADLRLLRNGTTLRRRTGGDDAGWHLKLPVAADERLEIRRAPGRSERVVPPGLVTLVGIHLRGEPVGPVARIRTRRVVHRLQDADGALLAEVADDAVSAEVLGEELPGEEPTGEATVEAAPGAWREIEVELVAGDRRLLKAARKRLVGAGARPAGVGSKLERTLGRRLTAARAAAAPDDAPPATAAGPAGGKRARKAAASPTAGEVVVDYLAAQLAELKAQDPRVKLDAEEGVHQMRVATRRLRTAMAAFRPLFAAGSVEPLRAELRWLAGELGAVRDLDVLRERLQAELAAQPAQFVVGPVVRRVGLELRAQRKEARARLLEALDGERYYTLVGELERFVARPPFAGAAGSPAGRVLRRRVATSWHRVLRAHEALAGLPPGPDRDHQLHQVRIAAKRARYAAEAAVPVHGKDARRMVGLMKDFQDSLGNHQDAVVEREVLRDLAIRTHLAGENAFTLGRLHGLADARAVHDEELFVREWKAARATLARWPG